MYGIGYIYCNSRWLLPWCYLKGLFNGHNWGIVYIVPMYRLKPLFRTPHPRSP